MTDTDEDDTFALEEEPDDIFTDEKQTYLDQLCGYRSQLQLVFSLCSAGLLLSLIALPFYEMGGGPFTLTVVNIVGLTIIITVIGYVLWRC